MNLFKRLLVRVQATAKNFYLSNNMIIGQQVPTPKTYDYLHSFKASSLVHSAAKKIADKIAGVEWELFQLSGEKATEIDQHPLLDLLARPNPVMSGSDLLELTSVFLTLVGNAYWYKARNGSGEVIELWSMRPDLVRMNLNPNGSVKEYVFKIEYGIENIFPVDDVIHFTEANPLSDYYGLGAIVPVMEVIMSDIYAKKWNTKFFYNSARPDAIITTAQDLNEEQQKQVYEKWMEKYGTYQNAFKVAVLSNGLKYQAISSTQKDMDFANMRINNREDVLMALQVPKTMLGLTEEVNRASAETAVYVFLSETIVPKLKKHTAKLNHALVQSEFGFDLLLQFIDPTPQNQEALDTHYNSAVGVYMTKNEVRMAEGLDPVDGGDDLYVPVNMVSVGTVPRQKKINVQVERRMKQLYKTGRRGNKLLGAKEMVVKKVIEKTTKKIMAQIKTKDAEITEQEQQDKEKKEVERLKRRAAYKDMHLARLEKWEKAFQLMVAQLFVDQAKRAVAKLLKSDIGKDFKSAKDFELLNQADEEKVFVDKSRGMFYDIIKEAGEAGYEQVLKKDFDPADPVTAEWIKKKTIKFATQVNETTIQKLKDTLAEGVLQGESIDQLKQRIKDTMADRITSSSRTIARTEVLSATNAGTLFGYKQSDVVQEKEWLSVEDDRVRPDHADADGQVVGIDEAFSVGGDELDYPGDPSGDPDEIINCRCTLLPVINNEID